MKHPYTTTYAPIDRLDARPRESNDGSRFAAAVDLVKSGEPFHLWVTPEYRVLIGNIYVHAIRWLRERQPDVYSALFSQHAILVYVRRNI